MKELIRKILREGMQISTDAPDWVEKFHALPTEGRIEFIENYKKRIEKLLPRIIEFFEEKFGDYIDRIEVEEKGAHYGSENHSIKKPVLKFYFNDVDDNVAETNYDLMKKVRNDLKNFFNIDLEYYGVPLDLEFYIKTWERM
jgi:hypothetical protein